MIKNNTPLSMAECLEYTKNKEENAEIIAFIKKFSSFSAKEAGEIKNELTELDLLKLKKSDIVKIIDLIPENSTDLNRIFEDIALDENETNKILEIVKKHR